MGESLVDRAKPEKKRRVTWLVSLEETTVGSGAMAGVLSPDRVVADLEFVVTRLVVEEVVGLERGTRATVMVVARIPGLALAVTLGGKAAVAMVVVTVVGLAPPGCREVVRDSSRVVLVGRGVRVVLLGSGALD